MGDLQRYDGHRNAPNGVAAFFQRIERATGWQEQLSESVNAAECRMTATTEVTKHAMDEFGSLTRHSNEQTHDILLALDKATRKAEQVGANLDGVREDHLEQHHRYLRTVAILNEGAAQRLIELTDLNSCSAIGLIGALARMASGPTPPALAPPDDEADAYKPSHDAG